MRRDWHIVLLLGLAVPAFAYEMIVLINRCILPAFTQKQILIEDFSIYYNAAATYLSNKDGLYAPIGYLDEFKFIYPPICILVFLPFLVFPLNVACVLWIVLNYLSLITMLVLFSRVLSRHNIIVERWLLSVGCLASIVLGSTFTNATLGNINAVLILPIVFGICSAYSGNPILAGFSISLAVWIKVYPVLLVPFLLLTTNEWKRFLCGLLIGAVGLPLIFLHMVPPRLYMYYIVNVLPSLSSYVPLHAFNQSLVASLGRYICSTAVVDSWAYPDLPIIVKLLGYGVGLVSLIIVWIIARNRSSIQRVVLGLVLTAVIPGVTPFGWGYTYLLCVPLVFFLLVASILCHNQSVRLSFVITYLLLLIPAWHILPAEVPRCVSLPFYARYPIAVALMCVTVVWTIIGQPSITLYRDCAGRSGQKHGL